MSKIRKGKGMKKLQEESTPIRDNADLGALNTSAITDMVSHFDEAAKRRLDAMNKRLKNMEREMEALEAEVSKINASSQAG